MTGSFLSLVRDDLASAYGDAAEPPHIDTEVINETFQRNSAVFWTSREMALDFGLLEPTPQERADRAAGRLWARAWHAERIRQWAEWFSEIRDVAGSIGAVMLDLHVPNDHDHCEGCSDDEYWAPWPCPTVEAAAAAAGIPQPEGT